MDNKKSIPQRIWSYMKGNPIVVILTVVCIIVGFNVENFFSWGNFNNLASNTAVRFLIALGVSGCLITKGTDLSAGRQVGLAACLAGTLLQKPDYSGKFYQNLPDFKDDSWADKAIRDDQAKRAEILSKDSGKASLERKMLCVVASTGIDISKIYDMSIRKFIDIN